MDSYIRISTLNDFIFCPKSIYFHELYGKYNSQVFQGTKQIAGKFNHESIDEKKYSTSKDILQGTDIYSEKYGLVGKIDLYHKEKKSLMERKTKITKIYQGQIWQIYAQYFCMIEMGYEIEKLKIYSMQDNKVYEIPLPNEEDTYKFEQLLKKYNQFNPNDTNFLQNSKKCLKCIYHELCDSYK